MIYLRYIYGISMKYLWNIGDIYIWLIYDISMKYLWYIYDISMIIVNGVFLHQLKQSWWGLMGVIKQYQMPLPESTSEIEIANMCI